LFVLSFSCPHFHTWLAFDSKDSQQARRRDAGGAMTGVFIGVALLALAGGARLKVLNLSQTDRDVLSGKVIYVHRKISSNVLSGVI
jgi:hypothetical protein